MRAAVFHEAHQPMTIETLEVAKPQAHEVLLRTAYAGLCHSDLHFVEGLSIPFRRRACSGTNRQLSSKKSAARLPT